MMACSSREDGFVPHRKSAQGIHLLGSAWSLSGSEARIQIFVWLDLFQLSVLPDTATGNPRVHAVPEHLFLVGI